MSIEIIIPDIGSDVVDVTEILVKVGDVVTLEQSLLTVEGDKASMEIPAPIAGTVESIDVSVGDKIETGRLIMHFTALSDSAEPELINNEQPIAEQEHSSSQETSLASVVEQVSIPDIGSDEVDVTEILVKVGDSVIADQALITVEGDKASMEIPAPYAGVIKSIDVAVGEKVRTGSSMMTFEISGSERSNNEIKTEALATKHSEAETKVVKQAPELPLSATQPPADEAIFETFAYAHASPLVRRLAREFGVDLSKVKGSGNRKRITKEDVQSYVKQIVAIVESGKPQSAGNDLGLIPWPNIDFKKFGETELVPLSKIQKLSGANLHRNWVKIPHVTQWDEVDITELEAFRQQQNKAFAKSDSGIKITPLVFILKAVATALEKHPRFNSSLSEDNDQLILKKYINIGVAVDTPNGLVVPVILNANNKGILELSQDLAIFSKKAREGKLTSSDMSGGCFTISSLGGIGGTAFTPIINAPEVAILGVSKSQMKPLWDGASFQPKLMLPLSLSYDHRVIDGAEGARFITTLNGLLNDIRQLIL